MEIKQQLMNRLMGGVFILLGASSLFEATRLMQQGAGLVGDHTFPLILGILFIISGVYFGFAKSTASVSFPQGPTLRKMLGSMIILVAYWAAIPYLGYTLSTFLGSSALFKTMGEYKWYLCLFLGAVVAACLHLIFREWLYLPFPSGLILF